VSALYSFVRKLLGINWRLWLTGHFLDDTFKTGPITGSTTTRASTTGSADLAGYLVVHRDQLDSSRLFFSLVQLISFIGILWSISITLVLVLVAYAAIGTVVTMFFARN